MSITARIKYLINSPSDFRIIPFKNAFQPYFVLILVTIGLYVNTLRHEVAYDDEVVLHKNEFVYKGVTGIPSILTHDSFYSYYKQLGMENVLPAGRYRPLSLITFAIEQEFIGTLPDGIVTSNSWDTNHNRVKEAKEDTNRDGLYNDYDFWVKGSGFRHFVNVILYCLLIILIYKVLSEYIFFSYKDMVFCSVLLFAVHPMHTEVVANIKSRDELLSLLFIFFTLYYALKYVFSHNRYHLLLTTLGMFLALLSKEYALFLFVLIPAILYVFYTNHLDIKQREFWLIMLFVAISSISLIKFFNAGTLIAVPVLFMYGGYFIAKKSKKVSTHLIFALGVALVLYLALRFSATQHQVKIASFESDIISNPYLFASTEQMWASKIAIWLKYLKLFFVPNPLLVDYSFNTIPYSSFSSVNVWISIIVYSGLIIATLYAFFKRSSWSFGLMIMLGFFLPIANVLIDIGATMGERLFFHSSLGICILLMMLVFKIIERWRTVYKSIGFIIGFVLLIQNGTYAFLTIKRNPDWKNNKTLFIHDVQYAPENMNLIFGASSSYYVLANIPANSSEKKHYLLLSNTLAERGLKIYPKHDQLYFNKVLNYFLLDELDSCLITIQTLSKMAPNYPSLVKIKTKLSNRFMFMGIDYFQKGDTKKGMNYLMKALAADKNNDKAWNNMGKALFDAGAKDKALGCFQSALKINPENKVAQTAIQKIKLDLSKP